MIETLTLLSVLTAGGFLGAIFFGGLWWTIQKAVSSPHPALWFLGSLLMRMSVTLAGFFVVSQGQWQRLLICLLGFVLARLVVTWLTRSTKADRNRAVQETSHAH